MILSSHTLFRLILLFVPQNNYNKLWVIREKVSTIHEISS